MTLGYTVNSDKSSDIASAFILPSPDFGEAYLRQSSTTDSTRHLAVRNCVVSISRYLFEGRLALAFSSLSIPDSFYIEPGTSS